MDKINHQLLSTYFDDKQLTRSGLAEEMGVARDTVTNVLTGKTNPCYTVMTRFAHAMQLSGEETLAVFFPQLDPRNNSPSA